MIHNEDYLERLDELPSRDRSHLSRLYENNDFPYRAAKQKESDKLQGKKPKGKAMTLEGLL